MNHRVMVKSACVLFLGMLVSPASFAEESMVQAFGPKIFKKENGTQTVTFSPGTTQGTSYLTVIRGSDQSKGDVKVNGVKIVKSNDFKDFIIVRKEISLQATTSVEVKPKGPNGSSLTVLITTICDSEHLPFDQRNVVEKLTVWQKTYNCQTPAHEEYSSVAMPTREGLFWLEIENGGTGVPKANNGKVRFNYYESFDLNKHGAGKKRYPITPKAANSLMIDIENPAASQVTLRLICFAVSPESSKTGGQATFLGAGKSYVKLSAAPIVAPDGKSDFCADLSYGVEIGESGLKLRIWDAVLGEDPNTVVPQSTNPRTHACLVTGATTTNEIVINEGAGFVEGEYAVKIRGKKQGLAVLQLIDCSADNDSPTENPGVITSWCVVIKDFGFVINGQCPSRNCPSTDECGPLGCLKSDGHSLLISQGLFMPALNVLPYTMGRNGLTPSWLLRYSSRAYSCGGHFGRTAFTMPCFERIYKDSSGDYVYQETKVRTFPFSTAVSNSAVTGWTAAERYEVLYEFKGYLYLRQKDGTELIFNGVSDNSYVSGKLLQITNRFGDSLSFEYGSACGQLEYVQDMYGRRWNIGWDDCLRVSTITEDTTAGPGLLGRSVTFEYDSDNRMNKVKTQGVTTDGGIGNTFTDKSWKYGYGTWTGDFVLDTNITSMIKPNETTVAFVNNSYGTNPSQSNYDRVFKQVYGGKNASNRGAGGTLTYDYDHTVPSAPKTTVLDRNGSKTVYTFDDCLCHAVSVLEKTDRNVRSGEGDYTTTVAYNSDGEITSITYPEGNQVTYAYDTSNSNRFAQGNLLTVTQIAGTRGGDGAGSAINNIVTKYTYEPIFQQTRTVSGARGNDSSYTPPNTNSGVIDIDFDLNGTGDGLTQRSRYTSLMIFDYQEGSSASISSLASAQKVVVTTAQAGALSLSMDLNGDGLSNQKKGNVIRSQSPVTVLSDGTTNQALQDFRYNGFGLMTMSIDGEGYLSFYSYGPTGDPDGLTASFATGGYPLESVKDFGTALRTPNYSTARTAIKTRTERNKVGMVTTMIDGRGIKHTFIVNERNQVQVAIRADDASSLNSEEPTTLDDLNYVTRTYYDANDNVIKTEVQNVVPSASSPTGGSVDNPYYQSETVYDILDNPIQSTVEVYQANEDITVLGRTLVIDASGSAKSLTTKMYYDRNENTVLVQSPLSVAGTESNNVSSTIYDERDLTYKSSDGGIDPTFGSVTPLPDFAAIPGGITNNSITGTSTVNYDGNKNTLTAIDMEDNGTAGADTSTMLYDGFDRAIKSTDAFGNYSETDYDPASQVTESRAYGPVNGNDPATPANNKLLSRSRGFYDELGRSFKSEVDHFKPPSTTVLAVYTTKTKFDRNSRVVLTTDARNNSTTMNYDGANRLIRSVDAQSNVVTRVYDDNSNLVQTKEEEVEGGSTQTYWNDTRYDAANRPILSVDSLGNARRVYYDSRGNALVSTDANSSGTTSVTLNRGGSSSVTINTDGNKIFTTIDGIGRQLQILRELRIDHDGSDEIDTSNSENSDGLITTKTAYDDNSRVTSRKDDKDNTTSYAYDHRNRKITETFADSTSRSWTYDKDSHLLTWTDQRGVVCTMDKNADIDALGRVLKATYTLTTGVSGTTIQTFAYDGLSRLRTATDNNQAGTSDDSVYSCTIDSLSRCIIEEQAIGEVSGEVASVYDANSNLTSLTYPRKLGGGSRVISYSYDNLDRVNSVDEGAAQLASYSFFGPGRINQRKYRPATTSPMTTSYSYDAVRRVTNIEHSNLLQPNGSTGLTLNFDYAFDREGSVIAEHATHEGSSGSTQRGLDFYSYDSAYRLTKEFRGVPGTLPSNNIANNPTFTGTASDDRAWTLDGVTNWKSYIDSLNGVPTTTTRAVNNVNEYGSVTVGMGTPVSRTHDNNGNLTDDGTNLYEYDALNRLVKVTRKSDSVVIGVHAWDAQSRRVLHTVTDGSNNENLRFFYKEGQLIEETDSEGSLVGQSVFGGMGERIESQAGFLSNRYLFEKLDGSIVSYADINKVVKAYYDYKAQGLVQLVTPLNQRYFTFGLFYASVNLSNSRHYLWQGVRMDFETGHYYGTAGTRMYDPVNGRKLQPSYNMWASSYWGLRYNSIRWMWDQAKDGNDSYGRTFQAYLKVICPCFNYRTQSYSLSLIDSVLDGYSINYLVATPIKGKNKFCGCYKKNRAGCNLIWEVISNKSSVDLTPGRRNDPVASPERGFIRWRPAKEQKGYLRLLTLLVHEVFHIYDYSKLGKKRYRRSRQGGGNEHQAVRGANQVRAEIRKRYKRKPGDKVGEKGIDWLAPRRTYGGTLDAEGRFVPGIINNPQKQVMDTSDKFDCGDK